MTTTFVISAHPEARSFTAHWANATVQAAVAKGDTVLTSDLSSFDPSERSEHYAQPAAPFDVLKEQERASSSENLPRDVAAEVEKLEAADRVIFHFPLWWFAPPAVLKGWFDRVLVHGRTHDVDRRFDTGRFRGRKALFCVTTGASAAESGPDGKEGNTRLHLWPAAYTLRYLGFDVLEPVVLHGVHGFHRGARKAELEERLAAALAGQVDLLSRFETLPRMRFNADTDFDASGRLKPTAPSVTPFIRRDA